MILIQNIGGKIDISKLTKNGHIISWKIEQFALHACL